MKKIIWIILIVFAFLIWTAPVLAKEKKVTVHFFWAKGCPHCAQEKVFLQSLEQKFVEVEVKDYEITESRKNLELLQKVGKELSADIAGVPFTVIGRQFFAGYSNDETSGREIETAVKAALENGDEDDWADNVVLRLMTLGQEAKLPPDKIKLPVFGSLKVKELSLPVLTFFIALIDGFNPCAMWTLLLLISLLLGMRNRKRMWILGLTFVAASALVYFLFLSAWLNLFLFLGFIVWIRMAVGGAALAAGGYYLRDYFANKKNRCRVVGKEKRQKLFKQIRRIIQKQQLWLALVGMVLLAFSVNLVELICSAGLPAIYTQILSLYRLSPWQYYLYLIFYVFIFMLDDLLVFFIAMLTFQAIGLQSKYVRLSRLIGGVLMLLLGILLLFKPEVLMFR